MTAIDRVTTYSVTDTNGPLFEITINQNISAKKCLGSGKPCNVIGICWCDPEGFSTRICYNHTSGGEGQLTLKCATYVQNEVKLVTIAGNCFFMISINNIITFNSILLLLLQLKYQLP